MPLKTLKDAYEAKEGGYNDIYLDNNTPFYMWFSGRREITFVPESQLSYVKKRPNWVDGHSYLIKPYESHSIPKGTYSVFIITTEHICKELELMNDGACNIFFGFGTINIEQNMSVKDMTFYVPSNSWGHTHILGFNKGLAKIGLPVKVKEQ